MYYIFNNEKLRRNVLLLQKTVQTHGCKLRNQAGRQTKTSLYLNNFWLHSVELGFGPALRLFTIWTVFHQSPYVVRKKKNAAEQAEL